MKYVLTNKEIKSNYGAEVLYARGVQEVEEFLNPTIVQLQDANALDNIQKAARIAYDVVKANGHIALIVDCDVDGYTSSAIVYQYLKCLNPDLEIDYYLHSGKQHGLEDIMENLEGKDYSLLIIPDAGSNDSHYIDRLNIPTIVIDHHILEDETTTHLMTLVNNQTSPNYTNKNLSGAGMAYQFCVVLDDVAGANYANEFIDLAALGVCGDMMSGLEPENQYLWREGFSNVKNFFFQTLMRKQAYSITGQVAPSDEEIMVKLTPISVAFYIVPLINAMIRVGTMAEKERLFLAFIDGERLVPCNKRGAKGTMEKVAIESTRECTNAKKHQDDQKKDVAEALEIKIHKHGLLDNKVLFIRLDDDDVFPSELNGLVCMQLSQKYKRPTILARLNNEGFIRGSARGLNKSEVASFKDFLGESGMFEYTVGHDNAFGISILNSKLSDFHNYANEKLANVNFGENVYEVQFVRRAVDGDIADIAFDLDKYNKIWSQQNDTPLIVVKDIFVSKEDIKVIGKNKDTIRFEKNGVTYIKFFGKALIEQLQQYDEMKIDVVGKTAINNWQGRTTPQIMIEDLEVEDAKLAF